MIGYTRVSTTEQADRNGLDAQRQRIEQEAARRNWTITRWLADQGVSGKTLERPALSQALHQLAQGKADGLVVAKLDRLTRSVIDFATLLDWFYRADRALIVLDCEVDTTTPAGEAMAHVMAIFAQFERRMISQRTKDGLAILRSKSMPISRPAVCDHPELADHIRGLRASGLTLDGIAERLNEEGIPTLRGGVAWRKSSVQAALGYQRRPARRVSQLPDIRRGR